MESQFIKGKPYFTNNDNAIKQYPYLTEDINCDVVIVGGGVTGAILAYYFSKNNINTVILEQGRVGFGSTSITTALLQYELDSKAKELEEVTSIDNVIKSYKLGIKALKEIEKFINEYGNHCAYIKRDCLFYTDRELEVKEIKQEYEIRKENDLEVEYINSDNNPFSFELKAGVYSKGGGAELDPYKFTHQLLQVALENKLKVFENTEVLKINYNADGVEVITNYENIVKAKKVIIATGYNTSRFTNVNFGIMTNTFNIVTKPIKEILGWPNKVLIRDNKKPYHYYRTTDDNRIIAGGEDIEFFNSISNESLCEGKYNLLLNKLKEMFYDIKELEMAYKYCGAFISTYDNLGYIGESNEHENQWVCLGYGANGILFAILGGMMLTKLYLGEKDEDINLFDIKRLLKNNKCKKN